MKDLVGQVIVITGANRGIGKVIYEYLEQLGAVCVNLSKSPCSDDSKRSLTVDITQEVQVNKAIEEVETTFGPIYGIVANAGILKDVLFENMTFEDWDIVIKTNLYGSYFLMKAALKTMKLRRNGSIVFINSVVGEMGNIGQANYSASKSAIFAFMKTLAKEYGQLGIRVNSISPGFVSTDMVSTLSDKEIKKIKKSTIHKRLIEPKEIAGPVAFLLSNDLSSSIIGENIRVNGGLLL